MDIQEQLKQTEVNLFGEIDRINKEIIKLNEQFGRYKRLAKIINPTKLDGLKLAYIKIPTATVKKKSK